MAETTYEDDVDIVGTVLAVDLKNNRFTIYPDPQNGDGIEVLRYPADREGLITEALRDHRTLRLRVTGRGEFSTPERRLCRISQADGLAVEAAKPESCVSQNHRPIWERLVEMAQDAPPEEVARLPHDLASNVDHYLYGAAKK